MTITNTETPQELQETLKTKLTEFMEENKAFNVQCRYTDDDGITATAIIDFGIQDRDDNGYYVADISSQFRNNRQEIESENLINEGQTVDEADEEKLYHLLGESDAFMDLEDAVIRAVRAVFKTPRRALYSQPRQSDIDLSRTVLVDYTDWKTRDKIDFKRGEE